MKEQILSTGKILISDIAQAIKNEIQPLDEKSQQRLNQITELDQTKVDQKAIELNEFERPMYNEIKEALSKIEIITNKSD